MISILYQFMMVRPLVYQTGLLFVDKTVDLYHVRTSVNSLRQPVCGGARCIGQTKFVCTDASDCASLEVVVLERTAALSDAPFGIPLKSLHPEGCSRHFVDSCATICAPKSWAKQKDLAIERSAFFPFAERAHPWTNQHVHIRGEQNRATELKPEWTVSCARTFKCIDLDSDLSIPTNELL